MKEPKTKLLVATCNTAAQKRRFIRFGPHLVAVRVITTVELCGPTFTEDFWSSKPGVRLRLTGGTKLRQTFDSQESAEAFIQSLEPVLQ